MFRLSVLKQNRGFTAIELIISLVILLIVLTLGYQALDQIYISFNKGEQQWIAQKEVQKLVDWFDNNLKNSYEMFIYENSGSYAASTVFSADDEYIYIYQAEDERVYFRNSKETNPTLLSDVPISVEFRIETDDPLTPKKSLNYSVAIKKEDHITDEFKMDSTVNLANMLRSSGINMVNETIQSGTETAGNVLKLQSNTEDLSSITLSTSSFCFIATAAYGTPYDTPVRILRQFRDKYLLTNKPGAAFVQFYYDHSPPIADFIAEKPFLKWIVRILLVPFICVSFLFLAPKTILLLLYVLIPALMIRSRRKKERSLPLS